MLGEAITPTVLSGIAILIAAIRLHDNPNDLLGLALGYVAGLGLFVACMAWRAVIACWADALIDWYRKMRGLPPRISPVALTMSAYFDRAMLDIIKSYSGDRAR